MSIDLFEHNETAYKAAVAMLAGTGKSFIGFKYCEDNPDKTVCWISPSEYIFKTQLENLKKTGAEIPKNIKFFTYAKLMHMSDEEFSKFSPNYIVLDEFHRCGAEIWGARIKAFLKMYPNAPVLGLSATNVVRYLDNQRDIAEELFDGNIASEMTLGEAIVRGILKAPLYISTVFSYQKELEKYMNLMYINDMSLSCDIGLMFATVKILFIPEGTEGIKAGQVTASRDSSDKVKELVAVNEEK